jgi:hypothetical protein
MKKHLFEHEFSAQCVAMEMIESGNQGKDRKN